MVASSENKSNFPLQFEVHGVSVMISGPLAEVIGSDFSFFSSQALPRSKNPRFFIHLDLDIAEPRITDLPAQKSSHVYPECVVYTTSDHQVIDYHGKAHLFVRTTHKNGKTECSGTLRTARTELLHELGYLFLQSKLGEYLDRMGLHRVHAAGLKIPTSMSAAKGAILVLIPSGGGKSSIALELMSQHRFVLLSDDSPLIDRRGNALPYPMRLAFTEQTPLPPDWEAKTGTFERRNFGTKKILNVLDLPMDVKPTEVRGIPVRAVFVAERHGSQAEPRIVVLNKISALLALLRDLVVGLGLAQVAELVLSRSPLEFLKLIPIVSSRMVASWMLVVRCKTYRLILCPDSAKNAKALIDFI